MQVTFLLQNQNLPPSEVKHVPKNNVLPGGSAPTKDSVVLISLPSSETSMDVSSDGKDAFSDALLGQQIEDIDAEDMANPQHVGIYVNSIYSYMRQMEVGI